MLVQKQFDESESNGEGRYKSCIGRPTQLNRTIFMRYMFPGWREEDEQD